MPISQRQRSTAMVWNSALTANTTNPLEALGATRYESEGRTFKYVQSADALTIGLAVRQNDSNVLADNRVLVNLAAGYAAGFADFIVTDTTGANLPTAAANSYRGWYATVNFDAARLGDTYRIVSNTNPTGTEVSLLLDRGLDNALVDNDTIAIWSPFYVQLAGGAAAADTIDGVDDQVAGIAVGTITAANYGWVQTAGVHPQVALRTRTTVASAVTYRTTDTDSLLPLLVPSATAGRLTPAILTGIGTGAAATNAEIIRALNARVRALTRIVLQATAANRFCPASLFCDVLGD